MILTFSQIQQEWGAIFQGEVLKMPDDWTSKMPSRLLGEGGFFSHVLADPRIVLIGASQEEIDRFSVGGLDDADLFNLFWAGVSRDSFISFVTAARQLLGEVAQSIGILSTQFPQLTKVFAGPADKAIEIVDIVRGMISSEMFGAAFDWLGEIPFVGWVIKIVTAVVKMVTTFFKLARNADEKMARSIAAKQLTVPISGTRFSTEADEEVAKSVLQAFRYGDVATQLLAMPPYVGEMKADGVYDDGDTAGIRDSSMSLGWLVRPDSPAGAGFVPGTGNMTGSLFFTAGAPVKFNSHERYPGGGTVRDTGALYPTATGLLNAWWSMVLQRGPMMFTVNPNLLTGAWAEYVYQMLKLGPDVRQGWAQAPTGIPFTNKFWCIKGMGPAVDRWDRNRYKKGVDGCKYGKRGKQLTLPSEWGIDAHRSILAHVYRLFFGLQKLTDREGSYRCYDRDGGLECYGLPLVSNPKFYEMPHEGLWAEPDSVDVDQCIPVRALENLRERQVAVLQSLDAFYVNGENPDQFAAFKNNSSLVDLWTQSITAIVNSNDWRRVRFADVPEGRAKEHLRRRAELAGIDPETLNPPCPPGAPPSHPCRQLPLAVGPSVLGDPSPPPPPPPMDAEPGIPSIPPIVARPVKKRPKAAGGAGALIAIGAVAAFLATRK